MFEKKRAGVGSFMGVCFKCLQFFSGEYLVEKEYRRNPSDKDGYVYICLDCLRELRGKELSRKAKR